MNLKKAIYGNSLGKEDSLSLAIRYFVQGVYLPPAVILKQYFMDGEAYRSVVILAESIVRNKCLLICAVGSRMIQGTPRIRKNPSRAVENLPLN
jgi:hypothetical protein